MTLKCSFLVYPESGLDIIWLADYNSHNRLHLEAASGIPPLIVPTQDTASRNQGTTLPLQQPAQMSALGRLPAEERFVVLYDSKLHRPPDTTGSQRDGSSSSSSSTRIVASSEYEDQLWEANQVRVRQTSEVDVTSVQGTRLVIKETRAIQPMESILKESQIIIQETQVADSAR